MKRLLVALLLALSTTLSAASSSLAPINRLWNESRPICTVFAIGPHDWLTAAHCVLEKDDESDDPAVVGFRTIHSADGQAWKADVVKYDQRLDLAKLQVTGLEAQKPLKFAYDAPQVGDKVDLVGYPRVWVDSKGGPIRFENRIAALHVQTDCYGPIKPSTPYQTLMQGSGAPGNSGSPVLKGGLVVGVLQCGFPQGIEAYAPWDVVLRWVRGK